MKTVILPLLLAATLLGGCDGHDAKPRLLPAFKAHTLDNRPLNPAAFSGKPWIITLWVPA